jgi:hypothetical protein
MEASPKTLRKLADQEAEAAEAEAVQLGLIQGGADPFAKPGEQGIATQDEEPEAYTPPDPTQQELGLADEVFRNLDERAQEMDDLDVIEALISLVDVHKQFRTPTDLFASSDDEAEKYEPASVVGEIARLICRGCSAIEAPYRSLVFYFKDHEKWTSAGQKVHGKVKRFDGFLQYHLEGQKAAVIVNYHLWKVLNPRQKTFRVYNLLREIDASGARRAPDWTGYFEEPALFGAGVHEEWVRMAQAFVREAPNAGSTHQLSLLAGIYEED